MTNRISRRCLTLLASALSLIALVPQAQAQGAWPNKPIKLVAVFPPGGSVDQVARILAQSLSQQLGQSVVVENKVGASGVVGTQAMATAPADGYTWAMVFDTHGVNPSLIASMPYDSKKDLVPLILVGTSAMLLARGGSCHVMASSSSAAVPRCKRLSKFRPAWPVPAPSFLTCTPTSRPVQSRAKTCARCTSARFPP